MKTIKHLLLFQTIILLLTQNTTAQNTEYEILYLKNSFDSIINIADKKIEKGEGYSIDYYWYSTALNKKGENIKNNKILKKALIKYPNNKKLKILIADSYYNTGNYNKAMLYLKELKTHYESQMQLAKIYEFYSEYRKAIKTYKNILRQYPSSLNCLKNIGKNYYRLDSLQAASRYYKSVLDINPEDQYSNYYLSKIYLISDSCEKAIKTSTNILKYDSLNTKYLRQAAYSYFKCKKFEKAKLLFAKNLILKDSSAFNLKHLGIAYIKTERYYAARTLLTLAYQKDSSDFETSFYLGRAYLQLGMNNKGLDYINKAYKIIRPKPELVEAVLMEKASAYRKKNLYKKEISAYDTIYQLSHKPEYLYYIASVYQNKNKKAKALKYYKMFIDKLPGNLSTEDTGKDKHTVSLRKAAEHRIKKIKEELFFEGE